MRLKKEQIHTLASQVFNALRAETSIKLKASEDIIRSKISETITLNLAEEDKLEQDVKKLMDQYKAQISSGKMDAQKVFQMIKKQLVKERGLVI